jgi:putative transposase
MRMNPGYISGITEVNASWSLDFMYDSLWSGKRFRTLNVIDEGVRECLAIEVDTSLKAERVVRVLERLKSWRGVPRIIRLDNGPELTSVKLQAWCESNGVELRFIQPGKPNQNAFIERFNRTFRSEVLNAYIFESLDEVREAAWWWMVAYNEERPHDALGGLPPSIFRKRLGAETSTFEL